MLCPETVLRRVKELGFSRARLLASEDAGIPFAPGTFVLCALSCHRKEQDDGSQPGDPHGLIAPFARRNYYGEAVSRFKTLASEVTRSTSRTKGEFHIFSNSRLPEKNLAARCGLGFYGRNSLIIAPGLGSLFVIAGIHVPFRWPSDEAVYGNPDPGRHCGSCRACLEACPTQAISASGSISRDLCLQALSTDLRIFPPSIKELWGHRLYGCQTCQDVCPFNRDLSVETQAKRGELGPSIPLRTLLGKDAGEMLVYFKGTVLDRSWIPPEAILRNAVLAAGNRGDPALIPAVEAHRQSRVPCIADCAEWALGKLRITDRR